MIGVDSSREMLAIARRRCRGVADHVRFQRADLAAFRVREPCAVASACGDVFNHMLTRAPLVRILRQVRKNLLPGGVLVFEAHSRFAYEHYWNGHDYWMEGPGGDLAMCCEWDPRRRLATVRMIGYARNGRELGARRDDARRALSQRRASCARRCARRASSGSAASRGARGRISISSPRIDRNLWTARVPGRTQ